MNILSPWYLTSSLYAVDLTEASSSLFGKPLKERAYVATECAMSWEVLAKSLCILGIESAYLGVDDPRRLIEV